MARGRARYGVHRACVYELKARYEAGARPHSSHGPGAQDLSGRLVTRGG
jgi:hypothetical protein